MSTSNKKTKSDKNLAAAKDAVGSVMRKTGLGLADVYSAVSLMAKDAIVDAIVGLRNEGCSIRAIARKVHMSDRSVSKVVKCNCCEDKPCKPGKPCKPCKPCKPSKKVKVTKVKKIKK